MAGWRGRGHGGQTADRLWLGQQKGNEGEWRGGYEKNKTFKEKKKEGGREGVSDGWGAL